jgi:hypothetical protein
MTEAGKYTRRRRLRMRAATLGAVFAAVAASAAIAAAGFGPVGSALASPRATTTAPAGWAPVPYRGAQLWVPRLWMVESPHQLWCGTPAHGMIFAGRLPGLPKGEGCHLTENLAWIVPAGHIPPGTRHRKPTAVINGIPVYRLPSGPQAVVYLVPRLGVRVGASGPLAHQVLETLGRSPLSVVLGRGPAATVPVGWVWHRFGGTTFATPRSWGVHRQDRWETCGTGLWPGSLLLIHATKPSIPLPCPLQIPTAAAERAQPGLTVVSGKYAARSVGEKFTSCQVRHGARICLSSVTGQGGAFSGVLIFSVSAPGSHQVAYFLLGLTGPGATPRAVFDSIRAAVAEPI